MIGPIPANAGEPAPPPAPQWAHRAYPRERGGTQPNNRVLLLIWGLSPRTRGNPPCFALGMPGVGPIPANAGEPRSTPPSRSSRRAYPRERGGTAVALVWRGILMGLSPRTRGNHEVAFRDLARKGPIPANAGEPARSWIARFASRAYPRERGGTLQGKLALIQAGGLSPRTRGNPKELLPAIITLGPIPANAGEPNPPAIRSCWIWAYPRERGGTCPCAGAHLHHAGLSPRTRGNRPPNPIVRRMTGPIPANAGEPVRYMTPLPKMWAYPRERGGTDLRRCSTCFCAGLSPRTRGNPVGSVASRHGSGPIPANAGEPVSSASRQIRIWAYPRERGGTGLSARKASRSAGLSPRTRGNPTMGRRSHGHLGPIPANAGEPQTFGEPFNSKGAYPRERGGTKGSRAAITARGGLSPRTRGNLTLTA